MATRLVDANLAGHDSHGVVQLLAYVDRIRKGHLRPGATIEMLDETNTTARVNGNWGFGYVVSTRAMELAIAKAQKHGVAALSIFCQGHIGRLATYPCMAAKEGMVGLVTSDSGRSAKGVAPFGGREARLGTNPLCIAIPSDLPGPVFIDMATSVVAEGKVNVARQRGEQVPLGWLIDSQGNPTTNPKTPHAAILPLGGNQGHKGYGLSFMIEIFAGLLTGLGYGVDPSGRHNDGVLMLVFRVDAFRPLADFKRDVGEFVKYIVSTPPAPGFKEVLYPGEPEWRTSQTRLKEGIFIEDATWQGLTRQMGELGVADKVGKP